VGVEPAARTLEVVVHEPGPPRATIARTLLGPLAPVPPRYEVLLIDRTSRATLLCAIVDRSRHEANALAILWRDDLITMNERAFLKKHGRGNRPGKLR
jgi:hypothetical protein